MSREYKFTPWKPTLVFYNSETKDLYKPSSSYEMLVSDISVTSSDYCTELCDTIPDLGPHKHVINQIKGMMKNSLPKQVKGLQNGKSI